MTDDIENMIIWIRQNHQIQSKEFHSEYRGKNISVPLISATREQAFSDKNEAVCVWSCLPLEYIHPCVV